MQRFSARLSSNITSEWLHGISYFSKSIRNNELSVQSTHRRLIWNENIRAFSAVVFYWWVRERMANDQVTMLRCCVACIRNEHRPLLNCAHACHQAQQSHFGELLQNMCQLENWRSLDSKISAVLYLTFQWPE